MDNNLRYNLSNFQKLKISNYKSKLAESKVPVIFEVEHLRRLLGLKENYIELIILNRHLHYHEFYIPKKNGGERKIVSPSVNLKKIQRWILDIILSNVETHHLSFGFKQGVSIVDNAKVHLNKELILCVDIKDFFNQISEEKVTEIFRSFGYSDDLCYSMSMLCCYENQIPQGAPTSPSLSNIYFSPIDKELDEYCKSNKLSYSRYADDISVSGSKGGVLKSYGEIVYILNKYGFELNYKKTRFLKKSQSQKVTGLIVNGKKVNLPKKYRKNLRLEMYYLKKNGLEGHLRESSNNNDLSNYKGYIYGKVNFLKMFDKDTAIKYYDILNSLNWDY
ncbi:retron St85 family RNA-directed DNA polymerase [Floricoccus penangensis]|uniref:retron St85 family RNA-directed DNA polymerase n=1 Tax=Floricoccus penangensis TaxID=1859475 RepID=UPI002040D3F2|nr:retron St85 family RNA-directed DNA polymerase [Floricoccus penangensis]URZ88271.1 retron St85 family RNA-directed DNA polymerase [Floricoccus penangensis]